MASERLQLAGLVGEIETVIDQPSPEVSPRGIALVAHPHPLFGGTLDNKVAQTLARAFVELGYIAVRPNFRGVGKSEGTHDEGNGETEDLLLVSAYAQQRFGVAPLVLAGFSFGSLVQSRVALRTEAERMVFVGTAVTRDKVENVPADTIVIHGEADEVVPLSLVLDWARPQELPVTVIPGADHFFHRRLHIIRGVIQGAWKRA